mgnify:FL=1
MKSKQWIERQKRDIFVNNAKKLGYLSRAAFKIIDIEAKFKLIQSSKNILELGSAPGSWSQVILEINDKIDLFAFDINDMKFTHPKLNFIQEDFKNFDFNKLSKKFDLILSDIAPNTTGHKSTDHLRISSIINNIINLLNKIASHNSSFVFKMWKGSEEKFIINKLKEKYKEVNYFKPKSSRAESVEIYVVAQKFIK